MTPLGALEVLVVDCQATAAASAGGRLLELGWARVLPGGPVTVSSRVIAQPDSRPLPWKVQELTGISDSELRAGLPAGDAWAELLGAAGGVDVLVAHFAQFELPFLRELHGGALPFEPICTLEIARRLWPGLPRRGLHAVAGKLGHVLPEQRRARGHVEATALVWRELVNELKARGIDDLATLRKLLGEAAPKRPGKREWPLQKAARLQAPDAPGVYRFLARGGALLYIGKATSLRRRVNSYFQKSWKGDDRKLELLTQVESIEWTVTETEVEAALLETDEIKERAPRYNVALRARDPALTFASADLTSFAALPDPRHPLGPFPGATPVVALRATAELLAGTTDESAVRAALRISSERFRAPGTQVVRGGLELLRRKWAIPTTARLDDLLGVGAALWRLNRETASVEEERPESELGWWDDPAAVAESLELTLLEGTRLLRRAAWIRQLADATVAWDRGGSRRVLALEQGRIAARGDLPAGGPRLDHGWSRVRAGKRDPLDHATYERLRILTTEVRALVGRGVTVELFAGGRALRPRELARRLYWI